MELTEKTTKSGKTVVGIVEIQYSLHDDKNGIARLSGRVLKGNTVSGYVNAFRNGSLGISFEEGHDLSCQEIKDVTSAILDDIKETFEMD